MGDDATHLLEVTLHDGLLEGIEETADALRLVVDVPFVRAHHGRGVDHRYWLTCERVTRAHIARWREPMEPRPVAIAGESAAERAARDEAWAALGTMEPVTRAEVLPLGIVRAALEEHGAGWRLRLEGSVDRPYAWCVVELEAARVVLAESDGTPHDVRSFAALGRAYWDAWARTSRARGA